MDKLVRFLMTYAMHIIAGPNNWATGKDTNYPTTIPTAGWHNNTCRITSKINNTISPRQRVAMKLHLPNVNNNLKAGNTKPKR